MKKRKKMTKCNTIENSCIPEEVTQPIQSLEQSLHKVKKSEKERQEKEKLIANNKNG
jgi:hypothetical protein